MPLLLLYEKNIIKIIYKAILVLLVTIIAGIGFPQNTAATDIRSEIRNHFLEAFLGNKLSLYNGVVPLVVVMFGIICVYCYLTRVESEEDYFYYSILVPLVVMFVILISFDSNPYWFVYLSPFLALVMAYNSGNFKFLILFESIGMMGLVLNQYGGNYWVYETDWAKGMMLERLFGSPEYLITLKVFNSYTKMDYLSPVFFAIFVVCIATVIWLSRPKKCSQNDNVPIRRYAILRMLLNVGIALIPEFVYLLSFPLGKYLMNR